MIFYYKLIDHDINKMQEFLDFIFYEVWMKANTHLNFTIDLFNSPIVIFCPPSIRPKTATKASAPTPTNIEIVTTKFLVLLAFRSSFLTSGIKLISIIINHSFFGQGQLQ